MECYLIGWMFLLECPRGPNKIAAIYSQHVPSRCRTLDLVAPVPRPCARLTDLETVLLLATVYNYIYIYISSRLTCQELLLVTYSGK